MTKFVLLVIRFYQRFLSFDTGIGRYFAFGQPVCRHYPTCSHYTYQAIERFGAARGLWFGFVRILKCWQH